MAARLSLAPIVHGIDEVIEALEAERDLNARQEFERLRWLKFMEAIKELVRTFCLAPEDGPDFDFPPFEPPEG